jgi:TorA maturation chaperone TorD
MADVGGFYQAFGLRVGRRERERVDHVTTDLEFMRFLTRKEAFARVHHGRPQIDICRRAQRRFWREHLGVWLPTFAMFLTVRVHSGFYCDWAQALVTLAEAESRALGKATAIALQTTALQTFGDMDCSVGADGCPLIEIESRGT